MAGICVVCQSFADDSRLLREVRALTGAGHAVDLVCLRRHGEAREEIDGSLAIHRLPMAHRRSGIARYVLEYTLFPLMAAIRVFGLDRRRRFDLVQVNTLPDWLVFAAIAPRARGVPILLDLHESTPEFFASKFGTRLSHPLVRLLARLERASIRFASAAITCTDQMRAAFISRGTPGERIAVVMNSADESIFDPERHRPRPRRAGRFSLISHGSVEERYGLDTMVRAVGRLRTRIPELTLKIYGEGSYLEELRRLVRELDLERRVTFHGYVPIDRLVAGLADADAGVVAMRKDPFRDLTHCDKMFDLITMRRPVICSRTESVMAYFPDDALSYFDAGDDSDLARAIEQVYDSPDLARRLVQSAAATNEPYRWSHQRTRYLAVVHELLAERTVSFAPAARARSRNDGLARRIG
jgi:glycosyltransferase involved in cell wall biosynthesis